MESTLNTASNGGVNYLWEQNFDGVVVYLVLPEGLRKADIRVDFAPSTLRIRLGEGVDISGVLGGSVDTSECTWLIDAGRLEVHLTKVLKGDVWRCLFEGDDALGETAQENDKKRIMLERFQNEHPGFDFSGAEFNGHVPEPRTFMRDK